MAKVIEGLLYSESHEYVKVEGNIGYVGISDYAQHALGNVVYVDMPDVDDEVEAGSEFGAVESVKAASDLIAPVSGVVIEVNEKLDDQPELINQDPYENWIIKVEMSDKTELDSLMEADAYEAFYLNESAEWFDNSTIKESIASIVDNFIINDTSCMTKEEFMDEYDYESIDYYFYTIINKFISFIITFFTSIKTFYENLIF